MGVANEVEIGSQHIPINVRRPTVDITRERGANLRVRERPGGHAEIVVRDERGGGRGEPGRPRPREPTRIDANQLEGIGRKLQTLKQQRAKAVNQLLGGPEQHRTFQEGLKSTRGGMVTGLRGLLNPLTWWRSGPAGSMAKVYDSLRFSRGGKVGHKLRAAPYGDTIYTTRGAERKRARTLRDIRGRVNPESMRTALTELNGAVDHAFAQLTHNPTPAQFQAYERQVAEATNAFETTQIAVEQAFRKEARGKGFTTGGSNTSGAKKLSRM
jgi:hypothetical protein